MFPMPASAVDDLYSHGVGCVHPGACTSLDWMQSFCWFRACGRWRWLCKESCKARRRLSELLVRRGNAVLLVEEWKLDHGFKAGANIL